MIEKKTNKKGELIEITLTLLFTLLPDQGSNLDFSDPESDVLPITPSGKMRLQK
jgi:hypothetical protein